MIYISWNCRGVGNSHFRQHVKELCCTRNPSALCLLETRVNNASLSLLPASLGFQNDFRVPSDGFAGGFWLMWNDADFTLTVTSTGAQYIHAGLAVPRKTPWILFRLCMFGLAPLGRLFFGKRCTFLVRTGLVPRLCWMI